MPADPLRDQLQSALGTTYTLERELGGGGMSRVFVADEGQLKRKVVVKVLAPDVSEDISAERFQREIRLAASLQQANIVPLLNAGEANGIPYYTMPFVDGESLRSRLASGPLPLVEVISILRDVARALAYAHEHGVVHRDIKPDNVLLSRGTAVVTDFGIAKAIAASRTLAGARITNTGISIGTPAYMAPEQAAAEPTIDARTDFYAFGCMAYELLTGQTPFGDRSGQKLLAAHLTEAPSPVTRFRPETPAPLARLIDRCLSKDVAERPRDADELLVSLESLSATHPAFDVAARNRRGMLAKALLAYVGAFIMVGGLAKLAITGIGLPDWVFPGAIVVMALGLPVILATAYSQYLARHAKMPGVARDALGATSTPRTRRAPLLSWRRTAVGGIAAVSAFISIVVVFMLLRAYGIGPAGSLLAAGRLSALDRLVVTDFRVKGADSSLGAIVSEAVRTELGQSSLVSVLSPTTVAAALQRMQRAPTTPVDLALARDIAQREGAKAVVDGDVTPLGGGFVLTLRLVTADSGMELVSYHETADGPKQLLPTLDALARRLRGKMGESLKRVHADPPLEHVTTSSLEGLRKFAEARRANNFETDYVKSARLLEEAIALDTTFAMAYRNLGLSYGNLGYPREKSDSAFAKAYRYRDRLTESERYLATADYFGGPGRDRAKLIAAYEDYLTKYPNEYAVLNNLAQAYQSRREFERADSILRRSIAANQSSRIPYRNLLVNFLNQGHVDSASRLWKEMLAKSPPTAALRGLGNLISQSRDPIDSTESLIRATLATTTDPQFRARFTEGLSAAVLEQGRLAAARRLRAEAYQLDVQRGGAWSPIDEVIDEAMVRTWFEEQPAHAVQLLDSALAKTPLRTLTVDQRRDFDLASTYALAKRADRARAVIAQFDADVKDTTIRRSMEPQRRWALSEIDIAEGRAHDAIEQIRRADRLPDGPADDCARCTYAALARAFDLAGLADSAIVMYERYLATPSWRPLDKRADPRWLAGTYKRLGELYENKGDRERAASYYSKFVELWKNADPQLQPKVAEVRKRLLRLSGERR